MEPNTDREGVEERNVLTDITPERLKAIEESGVDIYAVEGLKESIIDTFAKDFFSANCTCGAFHATKLKRFIKEYVQSHEEKVRAQILGEIEAKKFKRSLEGRETHGGYYQGGFNDGLQAAANIASNKTV